MSKFQAHKDAPDVVWLQIGYGDEGTHTWAAHQVAEDDIEQAGPYVRADRLSGRVAVKALEWRKAQPGRHVAKAPFNIGFYVVDQFPGGGKPGWMAPGPDEEWQTVNTLNDAFAAAQADFESRILAALDTAPAPEAAPVAEGLARPWPLRDCITKLCEAADILLIRKSYDGHGHELIACARDAARELLAAPAPDPAQIRREALDIVKRKSAEARKYPGASVAVTYLDEVAAAIRALKTEINS